jgi:plasmid stability protein
MVTITLKNIPEDLYERLKHHAKANGRSINSEIILAIKMALLAEPVDVDAWLARARQIREMTSNYVATTEEIEKAINEGRE